MAEKFGSVEAWKAYRLASFQEKYSKNPELRERTRQKYHEWISRNPGYLVKKRERRQRARQGIGDIVYFVQSVSGGPIKIGYTSKNPLSRLQSLQTANPEILQLLGVQFGDTKLESDLWYRFRHAHIKAASNASFKRYSRSSEWFNPVPELLDYIRENAITLDKAKAQHERQEAERLRKSASSKG